MTARHEDLAALKARVDLAEIVARHVDLKQRGAGDSGAAARSTPSARRASRSIARRQRSSASAAGPRATCSTSWPRPRAGHGRGHRAAATARGRRARPVHPTARAGAGCPAPTPDPRPSDRTASGRRSSGGEPRPSRTGCRCDYLSRAPRHHRWDQRPACAGTRAARGGRHRRLHRRAGRRTPAGDVTGVWRIRPAMEGKVERRGLGPVKGGCAPA